MESTPSFTEIIGKMWTYLCSYSKFNGVFLPFRYSDLRNTVLKALSGKEDGFAKCAYCNGHFIVDDIAIGYAIPLSRGGNPKISNLVLSCKSCHKHKGELTADEFIELQKFIEMKISLKRTQILNRNKSKSSIRQLPAITAP